ncbi:hypothetical protein PMIN06_002798 [Paraphaeosphaeria minitans]
MDKAIGRTNNAISPGYSLSEPPTSQTNKANRCADAHQTASHLASMEIRGNHYLPLSLQIHTTTALSSAVFLVESTPAYLSIYPSIHPAIQPSSHPTIHPSSHPSIHPSRLYRV